jgi:3-methyladenine DNA glycosylase AlkC
MVEPLKEFFSRSTVAAIGRQIEGVYPVFDAAGFERAARRGLAELELMPRARHIAATMHLYLPDNFEAAAAILKASLGPRLAATEGNGMAPFLYLPHVIYTAEYGLEFFEAALDLQYELTKRFSAEFSIRAFLERYPDQTLARLREWTRDPDQHVRRLVSEGTRPRLPWAPRLRAFQRDPAPVIELLELLKDDPDLYVRRSVANNLNDIGKDNPAVLFDTCKCWLADATPERERLVRHALRSAIKRAEPAALALLGHGKKPAVAVTGVKFKPRRVAVGATLEIELTITSRGARVQSLLVDLRVFFVKADGTQKPKVFKIKAIELGAGASADLKARVSLKQMTTRKHYPGEHRAEAIINGTSFPLGNFNVVEPSVR